MQFKNKQHSKVLFSSLLKFCQILSKIFLMSILADLFHFLSKISDNLCKLLQNFYVFMVLLFFSKFLNYLYYFSSYLGFWTFINHFFDSLVYKQVSSCILPKVFLFQLTFKHKMVVIIFKVIESLYFTIFQKLLLSFIRSNQ